MNKITFSQEQLNYIKKAYTEENIAIYKIAKHLSVDSTTIRRRLVKMEVPIRTSWSSPTRTCVRGCGKTLPSSEFHSKDYTICKNCRPEYNRKWKKENGNRVHKYHIKSKYGLSEKEYLEILEKQDKKCLICGKSEDDDGRRLSVDHCHNTNRVRGLLCSNCNVALGLFSHDIYILKNAIDYLS